MDDLFQELYKKESTISKILTFFTVLAIFISCLGLFGLSLFVARRKNKEIGIRKVHGAQIVDIVKMILREFVFTVILANFLALPITLISMRKWLSLFAYKIKPDISLFIIAFILSAFIVSLTLTINALKVARMNPAESLRDE
jgi:ABC-type antimicrobial peptide transport system permease subunit